MRAFAMVLGMVLVVAACASSPTAEQQAAADYGPPVGQEAAEAAAKEYLGGRLKDPYSAVYQCAPISKGFIQAAPLVGQKMQFGWLLDCTVNSKNSFGAYTGAKPYQFLFRDGRIIHVSGQECLAGGGCYMAPMR
ncbi:MAG: hypothetical protein GX856_07070 [Gammaproteobacteria bacterium]|jgi:hypothetical protein|nr:hypothetical protein [Gammaproteobacteria bacterium]